MQNNYPHFSSPIFAQDFVLTDVFQPALVLQGMSVLITKTVTQFCIRWEERDVRQDRRTLGLATPTAQACNEGCGKEGSHSWLA